MIIATLKAFQSGTDAPDLRFVDNPLNLVLSDQTRLQQGAYSFAINAPILSSGEGARWYIASNIGDKFAITNVNQTTVEISTFDATGEPEDARLNWNLFELHSK